MKKLRYETVVDTFIMFSIAVLFGVMFQRYQPYGLVWNATPSIPVGLYLSKDYNAYEPLSRGDIVCWKHGDMGKYLDRGYVPADIRVCKHVVGVYGDQVAQTSGKVSVVNAQTGAVTTAQVQSLDTKGRTLDNALENITTVAPETVLVLAPEIPNALDSRYLGLIPTQVLKNRMTPIWLR